MRWHAWLAAAVVIGSIATTPAGAAEVARPNVVVIFCDDMGYGDLACYGAKTPTPNIDRLAAEGVRFTDFYVAQAVCSASRAALMTGCYNVRVGILGALGPASKIGLNPQEMTLPRMFKAKGYATGMFGKWHLGSARNLLPLAQGFDRFAGVPYSHDMWPRHPENPKAYPDLPLYEGAEVVERNPEPSKLTEFVTERAVKFIDDHKDKPFFLYVPHPLPHVPLGVGEKFSGKTGLGTYADVIAEIDDSVGRIMAAIKRHGLDEKTIVMFSSDNGPWTTYGDHAGSAGGLREAKGTSFDGGVRVPFIARWPGRFRAGGVCKEPAMTIDVLPTLAAIVGAELPKDRVIDGKDMARFLMDGAAADAAEAGPLHEALFIYWAEHLQAVRSERWKLHFPHDYRMHPAERATGGKPNKARTGKIELSLFDLETDPGETTNVIEKHPDVAKRLEGFAAKMREDLGDSATKVKGKGRREPGRAE